MQTVVGPVDLVKWASSILLSSWLKLVSGRDEKTLSMGLLKVSGFLRHHSLFLRLLVSGATQLENRFPPHYLHISFYQIKDFHCLHQP